MNKPTDPPVRPEQVIFDDPAIDRLLGVLMALATEHYVLRDHVGALERQLVLAGHVEAASLSKAPDEAQRREDEAEVAALVESLLRPLLGVQEAAGVPGLFSLKNGR